MGSPSEAFDAANQAVNENLSIIQGFAQDSYSNATSAITALANVELNPQFPQPPQAPQIQTPNLPNIDANIPQPPTPPALSPPTIGTLPTLNIGDTQIPEVGSFEPSFDIQFPTAPSLQTPGAPQAPALADIAVPNAPDLQIPAVPSLTDINIPAFNLTQIEAFNAQAPQFSENKPLTTISFNEPAYNSSMLTEIAATIAQMRQGQFGMPAAVEDAIFARGRDREDAIGLKAEQEAFDVFAARGFDMPPGMLSTAVENARNANRIATATLSREIIEKAAQWQIDNLRASVTAGIQLEGQFNDRFQAAAARSFEVAKAQVDANIQLFNSMVGLFNAQQTAYATAASVYKTRIEARQAEVDVYRAQIEGEKAKGEINDQKVRVFTSMIQSLNAQADLYRSRVSGVQAQADVQRAKIEAFRATVEAYGQQISANRAQFEAYGEQVRAEASKAQIVAAQAQAFAETVRAVEVQGNLRLKVIDAQIEQYKAAVIAFQADAETKVALVRAQTDIVKGQTDAYVAQVQAYTANANAQIGIADVQVRALESQTRTAVALYEVATKSFDATSARMVEQTKAQVAALEGVAQTSAQLAAGAMSALHVGATISGSGSFQGEVSTRLSVDHNANYQMPDGATPPIIV